MAAKYIHDAESIFSPGVNMALIEREYPRIVRLEFEELNKKLRGEFRGFITGTNTMGPLAEFIRPFCETTVTAQIVLNELVSVIHDFMDLTQQMAVQIAFGQITSDHCRLFHTDKNHLRLLCTYAGKGTEWLRNEDVNRDGLGLGNNLGHKQGRPIQQLRPYDIAILKGDAYPENAGAGLVHRSPPMLAGDTPRIFLALDSVGRNAKPRDDIRWQKVDFPARQLTDNRWRINNSNEGLFCRQVKARFRRSIYDR